MKFISAKKRLLLFLVPVCAGFYFAGCSSTPQKESPVKLDSAAAPAAPAAKKAVQQTAGFERGKLIQRIVCLADTSVSYALYVPASVRDSRMTALVVFFDPHAAGAWPLKKYSPLAEKYGCVFVGSNNSKNGNPIETNGRFARIVLADIRSRVNIDPGRIYTCGFSGGSRVASAVAIFQGGINAVIGCGAGFPNIEKPIENKFNYVGIAGNEDFNSDEMEELERTLSQSDIEHVFLPFKGKHEWCPLEIMESAFTWIAFKEMKQNKIPRNDSLVKSFLGSEEKTVSGLMKKKEDYLALLEARKTLSYMSGLESSKTLEDLVRSLKNSPLVEKNLQRREDLARTEKVLKEQYLNAMALKDESWWKTEVLRMNDGKRFPPDQLAMNKRVLSYLSLACYMNINQLMHANQPEEGDRYISLYKIIDPSNPEGPYLQALRDNEKKQGDQALLELTRAAKLGFRERDRFERDFPEMKNSSIGQRLIKTIAENAEKEN